MKSTLSVLVVALFLTSIGTVTAADQQASGSPQWSADQAEVAKASKAITESYTTAPDIEKFASLLHPEFLGLYSGDPAPDNKAVTVEWVRNAIKTRKVIYMKSTPLNIKVEGNFAFVFELYTIFFKDAEGNEQLEATAGHSVFKKEGGKWLLFSEAGMTIPQPK